MLDLCIITKMAADGRGDGDGYSHGTLATGGEGDVDEAAGVLGALLCCKLVRVKRDNLESAIRERWRRSM